MPRGACSRRVGLAELCSSGQGGSGRADTRNPLGRELNETTALTRSQTRDRGDRRRIVDRPTDGTLDQEHDLGHPVQMSPPSNVNLYELLFQAAVSQFRERGYRSASISKITQEVGVAKGTFFNYFPTKDHVLVEAFHRMVEEALRGVGDRGLTGTDAILGFCQALADDLSKDRVIAEALVMQLSALPTPPRGPQGLIRDEERVRSWVEARLTETLPVSVPLVETDLGLLAFLVSWAFRGTVDEWIRSEDAEEALRATVRERVGFLLESAGLRAQHPLQGAV